MITLETLDVAIIFLFFAVVLGIGLYSSRSSDKSKEGYLLSGRNLTLPLFVLTNVATWYGGILGVGEFTYRYGLVSWFTQGLPYYIFAIIFAFLLAPKIRETSLFTIPEKITQTSGRTAGIFASLLVFLLVNPAPYILMLGTLLSLIFEISLFYSVLISAFLSSIYLFWGGYKSDVRTDAFEFFVMFLGFIILLFFVLQTSDFPETLIEQLPESHKTLTGGTSVTFILVWFLIALWTFADPGFHQRSYAAKTPKIAKWGIIISVGFWMIFDFLTTTTGLFSRVLLPNLEQPIYAFPLLAEAVLSSGFKGLFYAGLFATIISTLNSFLFLSATTFSRDFMITALRKDESKTNNYTRLGLLISLILSIIIALKFQSVIEIWYIVGSICIPGLVAVITGAYFPKFRISPNLSVIQLIGSVVFSISWFFIRGNLPSESFLSEIEPMIVGIFFVAVVYFVGRKVDRRSAGRV
ncbi:MAG: sodium:solute symporter family protein [Melioribacteraceae bacterium]|nr:sodium:solute symporter family protein [Melioribacteraceae bacterium]MCF8431821.1 sodium:solute symporter family protein [Melioribacteraceae bacterium]